MRARKTRGWMSRIDQLPSDIKERINARLRAGATQAAIITQFNPILAERNLPPLTRSGLNRYTSKIEQAGQRIREAREAAAAWATQAAEGPGDVGRLTIEILRTLALEMSHRAQDRLDDQDAEDALSPAEMKDLALVLQRLESADERSARRERVVREAIAKRVDEAGKSAGLSKDGAAAIRAAIMGMH